MNYMLPKGDWIWNWISFDLQKALNHLNAFLMEFSEYREESYLESALKYRLKYGIAGIELMKGEKRILYLMLMRNDERQKNLFMELKRTCEEKWNETHDEKDVSETIKNSSFGQAWFAEIDLVARAILISGKFARERIAGKIMKYFEAIDFSMRKAED